MSVFHVNQLQFHLKELLISFRKFFFFLALVISCFYYWQKSHKWTLVLAVARMQLTELQWTSWQTWLTTEGMAGESDWAKDRKTVNIRWSCLSNWPLSQNIFSFSARDHLFGYRRLTPTLCGVNGPATPSTGLKVHNCLSGLNLQRISVSPAPLSLYFSFQSCWILFTCFFAFVSISQSYQLLYCWFSLRTKLVNDAGPVLCSTCSE